MRRTFFWLGLALLATPATGTAQTVGADWEGRLLRVAYDCPAPGADRAECVTTGRLETADDASLRLVGLDCGMERVIPRAAITRLWVADGTRTHFWTGATVGMVAGMFLGAAIGSTTEFCIMSCSPATGLGAFVGLPAGFLLGGLTGAMLRSTRWRPVSGSDVRVGFEPRPGAVGLGVTVGF
jgi:hypothetical protein